MENEALAAFHELVMDDAALFDRLRGCSASQIAAVASAYGFALTGNDLQAAIYDARLEFNRRLL